ncbi:MAG: oxygen-independent coproporphyrinogen III oxidase [Lachnospiraceae bacterium]|nr:oxygen-independent coproporphyrinogen III oxidase [Lachnospiraceae bacterium]
MTTDLTKSELYIHIPFCVKKCLYCDFLSFPADEKTKERYIEALCDELMYIGCERAENPLRSVFIGGGTPSVLSAEHIVRVMDTVKERFTLEEDAEITIECNPGTLEEEKLKAYKECGINRLSLGLQSSHEKELKTLGRIHTYEDFVSCIRMAENADFDNINVDLMSGLPGQTASSFEETLRKVCTLSDCIKHISAYSLIVEEETPFGQMYEDGQLNLPDEDEDREMYHMTTRILSEYGFERYEISNYARPGFECRHNIGYWTGVDYYAAGLDAASFYGHCRYSNTPDMEEYLKDPISAPSLIEKLDQSGLMSEYMILGLRLTSGVSVSGFEKRFKTGIFDVYGKEIDRFIQDGLLDHAGDNIKLSEKGLDLANFVMRAFI